jgi:8-oxo-dGTP pyrophosphatase MutT (NUDIX family)
MKRISVRAIIVRDGKLFCVRQRDYDTGQPKDYLCTPGGRIDEGEALQDTLAREMVEETGVKPVIGNLLYIQQFLEDAADPSSACLDFFFHVTNAVDYENIDLSASSHGGLELTEAGFVDATDDSNNVLPRFLRTEPLATISKIPAAAKVISYLPHKQA